MEVNRGLSQYLAEAVENVTGIPGDDARPADFSRDDDARACAAFIFRLRTVTVPSSKVGPCQYADTYWKRCAPRLRSGVPFGGTTLAVTDWDPANIVISGGSAFVKVWHRPMIAATWLDAAAMILGLIAAGRHPADAEAFFARDAAFTYCPAEHKTRFIRAQVSVDDTTGHGQQIAGAARTWFGYDWARTTRSLAGVMTV